MNRFIASLYSYLDYNKHPDRYDARERHAITSRFLLCGLYCLVAVFFLLFFGTEAVMLGRTAYGLTLMGFIVPTLLGYLLIWYSGYYTMAGHLVVLLMGALCLFLFYNGGDQNTGPLWYFVFPMLALFLQGRQLGMISVGVLMLFTFFMATSGIMAFNEARYSNAFLQRLVAVYIAVTSLSYLFAYFKYQAEERLERINAQLETRSNTDKLSGMTNHIGMQHLLDIEIQRYNRIQTPFTLVIFDIDGFARCNEQKGRLFGDFVIQAIGQLCVETLRSIDTASRWQEDEFLILLPGARRAEAQMVAERLRKTIESHAFVLDGIDGQVTASFGVSEHRGIHGIERTLRQAVENLDKAKAEGGNRVCSSQGDSGESRAAS